MVEEKNSSDLDDWLDDFQDEEGESSQELNQSDIDSLLGGGEPEAESAQATPPAEEEGGDLDQSDIDALLGGGPEGPESPAEARAGEAAAAAPPAEEEGGALDQSDIDALLGGDSAPETPAEGAAAPAPEEEAAAAPADESEELDQSDIDSLFGAADEKTAGPGAGEESLSQDDMDELFAGGGEAGQVSEEGAETVSFNEVLEGGTTSGEEAFDLTADDTGLGADDEFNFDDDAIPEIPEEGGGASTGEEAVAEEMFAEEPSADEEATQFLSEAEAAGEGEEGTRKFPIPLPFAVNKTVLAAVSVCLVLAVGAGLYFFKFRSAETPPAIPAPERQAGQLAEPAAPVPEARPVESAANAVPVVEDHELKMAKAGGALNIQLTGRDPDGDPLRFTIKEPPAHGRLSGDLPNLTYLPNKDFPGTDRFTFVASDGRAESPAATVSINGPDLRARVAEKKTIKPARAVVRARNVTMKTVSTRPLIIDWHKIWRKANKGPFSARVAVEIEKGALRGRITRISRSKYRYEPDRFRGGNEIITYRFRKDGVRSKKRKLMIMVELGNPAPEIHIRDLAKAYRVGDTVVLDARPTRDDAPRTLMFSWQQTAGIPVELEMLNDAASRIAFVVPSSFYTVDYPEPVIRVTAVDQTGLKDSKDIVIHTRSRRRAALWRELPGNGIAVEPDCPKGNCPGALLPWPYAD